jgi:hypothetical protein
LLLAWGLLFLGWLVFGFQPNLYDQPSFSPAQEAFNVAAKDGLAAIFVIGGLPPFRRHAPVQTPEARAH